jgi:hypothetical protein
MLVAQFAICVKFYDVTNKFMFSLVIFIEVLYIYVSYILRIRILDYIGTLK